MFFLQEIRILLTSGSPENAPWIKNKRETRPKFAALVLIRRKRANKARLVDLPSGYARFELERTGNAD